MEEFKGTKIQHYVDNDDVTNYVFCDENGNRLAATLETAERNTKIFNEAFNVVTRTGLTPEQMESEIRFLKKQIQTPENIRLSVAEQLVKKDTKIIDDLETRLKEAERLLERTSEYLDKSLIVDRVLKIDVDSFLTKEKTK